MKFSIRDLLWLTVVVALAVGWWVDRGSFSARTARYGERLKAEYELQVEAARMNAVLQYLGDEVGADSWRP